MSFVLNEDSQMLRDTALSFMRDELPVSHLRALRNAGKNGDDAESRAKLAELGFFGVLVPEAHGGSDFGLIGMGQIMEAQGRTLAATPLLQTGVIAALAFARMGNDTQKAAHLPAIAEGKQMVSLALDETAHHNPLMVKMTAIKSGDTYVLNGQKPYIPGGHFADGFLTLARTSGQAGEAEGLSLFYIPANADGVKVTALKTVDSHGAANLELSNTPVPASQLIGEEDKAWDGLEPILDAARISLASEMLGSAEAAFEMTLDYLKTRKQFGQLIGSFQSLQHRAAKMFAELELTRSCVGAALSAFEDGHEDLPKLASLAKGRASDLIHLVSNECVQMHGGIGMTDEHDSGLYMKRARVQETLYGGGGFHRDRYAALSGY